MKNVFFVLLPVIQIFCVSALASEIPNEGSQFPSVHLEGFVQPVAYLSVTNRDAYTNQFRIRRARLDIRVSDGNLLDCRINGDLASWRLMDAYVTFRFSKPFNLTIGQFKHPLSRERAQSVSSLLFNDFSYTAQLAPNRDIGIRLSGSFFNGRLSYLMALLNGSPNGGTPLAEKSDHKDLAGRIDWNPLPEKVKGLSLGLGMSRGYRAGEECGSVKTPAGSTVFTCDTGVYANGPLFSCAPSVVYYGGKLTVIGEYVCTEQGISNGSENVTLQNQSASLSASVILSGGERNKKGFMVAENSKKIGGLEFVTRIHAYLIDNAAFSGFASPDAAVSRVITWEGGLNWYIRNNSGLKLTYTESHFRGGAADGNRTAERIVSLTANAAF